MRLTCLLSGIGSRFRALERDRRAFVVCLSALAVVSLFDVALLGVSGAGRKQGPNQILSPWDVSKAPPQCIHRSAVRIVKVKSATPTAQRPAKKALTQRAAFAPFSGTTRASAN